LVLEIKGVYSSETFVSTYNTTRCDPEDGGSMFLESLISICKATSCLNPKDQNLNDAWVQIASDFGVKAEVTQSKFKMLRTYAKKLK
jgi:hypothetical protein